MPAWGRDWHRVFRPQPGTFTSQPCGGLEPGSRELAEEPGGRVGRGFRCGRAGEGPGAWNIRRATLSSCPMFPVSFHPEPRWVQKLWRASFSPKEKTGTGEAVGAQGTPDSGVLEAGLLPSRLAPEARPSYQPSPPTPCYLPGSSPVFQCQLDTSLLIAYLQAQRSDLGSGH